MIDRYRKVWLNPKPSLVQNLYNYTCIHVGKGRILPSFIFHTFDIIIESSHVTLRGGFDKNIIIILNKKVNHTRLDYNIIIISVT